MQQNTDKITFLVGDEEILENMQYEPVRPLFDERTTGFLNDLSAVLLSDRVCKTFPDIVSYAFWIRRANLMKEKERFLSRPQKMGRGLAFHITPSNVPVNFAVSMTSALLAGNPCVLRVSNKEFKQVDLITAAIKRLLKEKYSDLQRLLCILRYDYDDGISAWLSRMCDIRIIWGGDSTIEKMRQFPLQPRGIELTFADRHSIAVIQAEEYLKRDGEKIADMFYTDTYYTDQNACSSPRLVIWMGERIDEAREKFWKLLEQKVKKEYEFSPVLAVDKYEKFCELAVRMGKHVCLEENGNVCMRVQTDKLTSDMMSYKMYGGYFFEYQAEKLQEMLPVLTKSCQTIAYLGISPEEILDVVKTSGVRGVDRVVPFGHTMDLSFFWDGNDMIESMSRYVYMERKKEDGV
jgi:hypothetical protein